MNATAGRRARLVPAATLAALVLWTPTVAAAEPDAPGYSIAPVPGWVAPVAPAEAGPDADAVGGKRHLLVDRQHHDDGVRVAYHHHHVTEVANQAGLSDASKLSVSFDPGYQRLELHSATVTRDGRTSDRLARARIDVARTENGHDRDLLHGDVTALVVLPDVRVGDRVEARYTVYGRNPVFGSRHFSSWRVRWGVPVERSVLSVTVPREMALTHTERPEAELSETAAAGLRTLRWRWEGLERSDAERDAPAWFPDPDRLDVTAYRDWREVADWGARLFADRPADGRAYDELSRSIRRIAETRGRERAIAAAIDHVQKRVRYYGLELGENSHRPHSPNEVLANGYGDCKDKALLLSSLLRDLGVDAWPILVSMRTRRGIAERPPSPGVFDHVVVLVEHGGERHWVDATDNRQAGLLGHRGQPEYGAGLVLGHPDEALVTRTAPVPALPTSTIHDRFFLSSIGGPVDFVTTAVYRGREANAFRRRLDRSGRAGLRREYEDFHREMHGELRTLEPLVIVEDAERNEITVTESYRLDGFWDVDRYSRTAEVEAWAFNVLRPLDELPKADRGRDAPFASSGPTRAVHRIQFHPNVASPERDLEETTFEAKGLRYTDSEYALGDSLTFEAELEIGTDAIDVDAAKAYGKFRDRAILNARSGRVYRNLDPDELELGALTTTLLDELEELER